MSANLRTLHRVRAFTLPEMMIAMAIIMIIVGIVGTIYWTSFHVWQRCSAESQADPPAHISLDRVTSELKNAYQVNSPANATNYITFTLPKRDANNTVIYPMTGWYQICYYLSDASASHAKTGTYLWREKTMLANNAVTRESVAQNVQSMTFNITPADSGRGTESLRHVHRHRRHRTARFLHQQLLGHGRLPQPRHDLSNGTELGRLPSPALPVAAAATPLPSVGRGGVPSQRSCHLPPCLSSLFPSPTHSPSLRPIPSRTRSRPFPTLSSQLSLLSPPRGGARAVPGTLLARAIVTPTWRSP